MDNAKNTEIETHVNDEENITGSIIEAASEKLAEELAEAVEELIPEKKKHRCNKVIPAAKKKKIRIKQKKSRKLTRKNR